MESSIRTIIVAGIVTLGLYLGYKFLLTPEAKEKLKGVAQKGVQLGLDMHDKVTGNGTTDEGERIAANKSFVEDQWQQAGF